MDTRKLNNEIILCRPAVRKAKVAVIRKLVRKIKILKSCKIEAVKEKKLGKSERLFQKVQVMKKIEDDEVTKFALRHSDIEAFLKRPELNLRQTAVAHLAKHKAVAEKVTFIRGQFQNWEQELPVALDSLKKRKKNVVSKPRTAKSSSETTKLNTKVTKEGGHNGQVKKEHVSVEEIKVRKNKKATKLSNQSLRTNSDSTRNNKEIEKFETIKKIEDPFFVGKKIVAPKLLLESDSKEKNSDKFEKKDYPLLKKGKNNSVFNSNAFRGRRNSNEFKKQSPLPVTEAEKLHPSWAAKKVKLIQPFQGKKITFSED